MAVIPDFEKEILYDFFGIFFRFQISESKMIDVLTVISEKFIKSVSIPVF